MQMKWLQLCCSLDEWEAGHHWITDQFIYRITPGRRPLHHHACCWVTVLLEAWVPQVCTMQVCFVLCVELSQQTKNFPIFFLTSPTPSTTEPHFQHRGLISETKATHTLRAARDVSMFGSPFVKMNSIPSGHCKHIPNVSPQWISPS